jgi:hypothetical protein
MNKIYDILVNLNKSGDQLRSILYNFKHALNPDQWPQSDCTINEGNSKTSSVVKQEQPKILTESNFQSIVKAVLKKYPEMPDLAKVSSFFNSGSRIHNI